MPRLLIIEDNVNQSALYADELTDDGYEVVCAANGPDALAVFKAQPPDLVVTDILLPCMTGIEVIERILASQPKIPIIIHSAYSSPKVDAVAKMARAYVLKSGNLDELKHHIRSALTTPECKAQNAPQQASGTKAS